ncbi:MAG: nucleotidyl transferase AbiEii/AbiGii toxin family protein [Chloroflexi bacterium]|nr:nucleotidyl transferase AbiEii/AbiGii toxin family protein [Chloroflexota bacterium]
MRAERIGSGQAYGGVRLCLATDLDGARIAIEVDISFGDAVTPGVVEADFPTLLDFPAPLPSVADIPQIRSTEPSEP